MKNRNALDKLRVASRQSVKEKDYWQKKMAGEPAKTHFPYDYRAGDRERVMNFVEFGLTGNLFDRLMHLSNSYDYTLYMVLAAVLKVLIRKYTAAEDIIIGAPIYKQEVEENLLNTVLALRDRLTPPMTFKELLLQVKTTTVEANENQNYPIELLLKHLNMSLPGKDFPLFDIAVLLENIHDKSYVENIPLNMFFSFKRKDKCIEGKLEYNANLYRQSTVERIISHFMHGLEGTLTNIEVKIDDINILSEQEQRQLLYDFNGTEEKYPGDKTIHELFEEQVARTNDGTSTVGSWHNPLAVEKKEKMHITYGVLNEKANRLAHSLKEKGVLADSIIGIMMERSIEMIIGLLGILKAGGAYLPIDPEYPRERIDYMLKDSGTKILLTNLPEADLHHSSNRFIDYHSGNLAYVIYTSGTTGRAKGTAVEHRNAVNTLLYRKKEYKMNSPDKALQLFSYAFDGFVTSFFTPLISGAVVLLLNKEEIKEIARIKEAIIKQKVTHFISVPVFYRAILDAMSNQELCSLKVVTLAGDMLLPELVEITRQKNEEMELAHEYGVTEAAVMSTIYRHQEKSSCIVIGKPIANTKIYILDHNNRLRVIGVAGELCISGAGVTRGYLNRPELTAEKFVRSVISHSSFVISSSEFSTNDQCPMTNDRLYMTGDLARWLPDGNIEFLGRIDHQVKVRGFRIELGEIESQLEKYNGIREAVVLAKEDQKGEKYLCAYIVAVDDCPVSELRQYLSQQLPGYMIPSYFVVLEKIPLTPNGKIDRKALPEPDVTGGAGTYIAPRNEVEGKLVEIWSEVLAIEKEKIGIDDNFFHLGGHSLKATYAAAKISKTFNVKFQLGKIFEGPTVRSLAGYIKKAGVRKFEPIIPVEKKEYYVLTPAQKRLYILQQMELESTGYNLPYVLPLKEDVNLERLEKAFGKLISRHESLRTSFELKEEEPVQRIHEENYKFQITNYRQIPDIIKNFVQPFDLSKAPLLRVGLIVIGEARHLLMIDMHHIITDGTSQGILTGELMALYSHPGKELTPLPLQYKDYAEWQNSRKQQELFKRQETYWIELYSDDLPVLNLPFDYPRPVLQSFAGSRIRFILGEQETKHLKSMAGENDATLYMTILSIFSILLSRLSGEEDIIVGTPIAGRQHPDTETLIGMFVNTLAMRNYPKGDNSFKEFLEDVKKHTLAAYENQEYPFDELVEKISVPRDTGRNPVFDVMFNLLNQADYNDNDTISLVDEGRDASTYYENVTAKFDLNLAALERGDTLYFSLEYCTKLFKKETVETFIKYFKRLTVSVIANPAQRLAELEILPDEEKARILKISTGETETVDDYPAIQRMFEEIVAKGPDKTALVLGEYRLTYDELNKKANQLAWVFKLRGITPDTVVGLMVERSIEMIIGIIAILKAGGACLPIDTNYPEERKKYMITDSSVKILLTLTDCDIEGMSVDLPGETVLIDISDEKIYGGESGNIGNIDKGSDLLYVIYTSGSTGTPRGVMLEHRNLVNLIRFQYKYTGIDFTRVLQFTTISFDVSFQEIFSTLLAGGELYLITKETRDNIPGLFGLIEKNEIKTLFLATGFLKFVFTVDEYIDIFPKGIAHLVTAGEQIVVNEKFKKYLKENHVFLHNHYGPSETHVVTSLTLDPSGGIPHLPSIGRPVLNTHIYILDKYHHLLPPGVSGELYIGGTQVGRGYSNRPELTAEKFIEYRSYRSYGTYLIYKTGDLARWLPDNNIEFAGRMDHQVKIRGFRIELGEIESRLLTREEIKETVVLVKEKEDGEKYLCAYIVTPDRDDPAYTGELRKYLNRLLPDYMVPSFFIKLDRMPLTPNGKINRQALPDPVFKDDTQKYRAPRDEMEKKVVKIWAQVLAKKEEEIGIDDNFFQLGGHSLKAFVMQSRIHKELNVKLPLAETFMRPTVREMSECIRQAGKHSHAVVKPAEKKEYYPLSPAQKRIYFLQQMDLNSTVYNMTFVIPIGKNIERDRIQSTLRKLISRHESLRTSFILVKDILYQKIHDKVEFEVEYYSATESTENTEERKQNNLRNQGLPTANCQLPTDFLRSFDLSLAPLLRAGLIRLSNGNHLLTVDMHHTISDGTSYTILAEDFMTLYNREELEPLKLQYKDFSQWQSRLFESGAIKKQESYWLELYADAGQIPRLDLPVDFRRPAVFTFVGDRYQFILEEEEAVKFNTLAVRNNGTLYMSFLALLNTLFYRYTGQTDIIIGTGTAGRTHADLERIIGMFINMLVMRNHPNGEHTYESFLKEVIANSLKAFDNQDVQFEDLVSRLDLARDPSRNALFDISLVVQNFRQVTERQGLQLAGEKEDLPPVEYKKNTSRFDMTFFIHEHEENVYVSIEYYTGIFKEETIKRLAWHLKSIIKAVTREPSVRLKDIGMIPEAEKYRLLYEFNDTAREYPSNKTLHGLFEEEAERSPEGIVLVGNEQLAVGKKEKMHITYGVLNEKADQLTHSLREKGVAADDIVGIMIERSVEMVIGIFGILKAGAAYLPIDPDYPEERKKYMLIDSNARLVVDQTFFAPVTVFFQKSGRSPRRRLYIPPKEANLSYIIYTSGTTGRPKGVAVDHFNAVNTLLYRKEEYKMNPGDKALQLFSYAFDGFVTSFFTPVISGSSVVLLNKEETREIALIRETIVREGITHFIAVPALYHAIIEGMSGRELCSLKVVTLAGDTLLPELPEITKQKNENLELAHEYGVTEAAVLSTLFRHQEKSRRITIGKPIANTQIYILDRGGRLQVIGAAGELCISGAGVSRGYLNRPDLTAEKFVNLLATKDTKGHEEIKFFLTHNTNTNTNTLYRTGDLARWFPEGTIEFLGRIDNQVKIRGFRIEPGEIENRLLTHKEIKDAVVVEGRDTGGDRYLCAYVVAVGTGTNGAELRQYLSGAGALPDYMIPSYFEFLEALPLTPNGKIDRNALPAPVFKAGEDYDYAAPRDEIEEKLANIWAEVLNVPVIGIDDNFFDLGGHSLKATTLTAKIHKELGIKISLVEVFKTPFIRGMSLYIKAAKKEGLAYTAVHGAEKKEYYPLSSAQGRFYILQRVTPGSTAYNMPAIHRLEGRVEKAIFENTLKKLLKRHESLRTSFEMVEGKPVQRIHDEVEFKIEYLAAKNTKEREDIVRNFIRPFDLSNAPLLRLALMEVSTNRYILMFDMHHIISDGASQTIFLREFMDLYSGRDLEPLRLQYKDFAQWQYDRLNTGELKKQEDYWLGQFAGEVPVLNMPTDFPRPPVQSFEGDRFNFILEKSLTLALNRLKKETGTTLFMVLLAVYNILLARYTGQADIVVGTTIAGRSHPDLENILGLQLETLALRNYLPGDNEWTFVEFLKQVKQRTLDAYDNQDYPFKELIRRVGAENEISRNPVFDVMLMVQNIERTVFELEGLKFSPYRQPGEEARHMSKVDFTLEAVEAEEEIYFTLEYCTRLYKGETMKRLAQHFINILSEVVKDPGIELSTIRMIGREEKRQLLEEFNTTAQESAGTKPVHEHFEDQAARVPDRIAVKGTHELHELHEKEASFVTLTYRELSEQSDRLAYLLIDKGVLADDIVGIMVERSIEMIIGILGILKAGGAYLPIDPEYPEERKKYMLTDSNAGLIVDEKFFVPLFFKKVGRRRLYIPPKEANLSYIIYTSGTTGRPKGVMVEHRNLSAYICAFDKEFSLGPEDTVIQQASYTFDASVEELYPILLKGGKLVVPGKEVIRDIHALCGFIARHHVTMITCSPQLLNELNRFPDRLSSLRILISGGDRLKAEYITNLTGVGAVYNTYGPTESTVCASYYRCLLPPDLPSHVPIGKPITGYRVYILDSYYNLLPVGVAGELCIAGAGITRGYLNQPELTAEKFIEYRSYRSYRPYIFYRTGDLGRWLPDGNIEFLGRIDRQVKIRGYRIELAEIENRLTALNNIKEALVVEAERKSGQNYLTAYVVCTPSASGAPDAAEMKDQLARQLPEYMIPPYIMAVEAIPLTPSGKVDQKRLPRPEARRDQERPYAVPGTHKEKTVAQIWKEVLEVTRVGLDDNFFDLGGTSLDIFEVNTRLNRAFTKQIPIVAMFQHSTVRSLVRFLEEEGVEKGIPGEKQKELSAALDMGKEVMKKIIKNKKEEIPGQEGRTGFEIAVIGMAGMFPGASNIDEFRENLENGIEGISHFSDEELLAEGIDAETLKNPAYIKSRGIIAGADYFDASFFGYTPREARIMDPQIRIFAQCTWHALEDAGYDPFSYERRIGLYAGASPNLQWEAIVNFSNVSQGLSGFMTLQLTDKDFMCTHISYKLNLRGPGYAVQTACSTSLVAIHWAVQGLLHGECEMALAGGISISYPPKRGYRYQPGLIFSSDGHNRSFDAEAVGSVFGDGAGVVVLKKLADALVDRDHIYVVIKGTAANNDGLRKVGFTAPSVEGQAEVIKAAQLMAEVEPESIGFIEAHGTATPLGDTVEIEALKQAFNTTKKGFCAIGTVKSNVGHLYAAAGAAGFIKTVLALKHRLIPPSLHFNTPNPRIDFESSPFYVNTGLKEWKNPGYPLRAGVSSFGIGGTNAHVVLEEWPDSAERDMSTQGPGRREYRLILLSARTPAALEKQTENLALHLQKNPGIDTADMAYTLQVGRKHFPYRRMAVFSRVNGNRDENSDTDIDMDKLARLIRQSSTALVNHENRPIVFMFCGQGSQYVDMGIDLYRSEPVFREEVDRCFKILKSLMGYDIKDTLYPGEATATQRHEEIEKGEAASPGKINQTEFTQPVVFAFEYALAKLLIGWGIQPWAMIGYSLGEYIAACISGVLSLEDALKLIVFRGQLMQQTPPGAMTSVCLPENELQPLLNSNLNKDLSLAIVNGPTCIVSGPLEAIDAFEKEMQGKRVLCVRLNMSHATHSSVMNLIRGEFERKIQDIVLNKPQIPFISNVTADWITAEEATNPGYWGTHLCSTVRFSDGLEKLLKEEENAVFIEIGAGRILGMMVRTHPAKKPGHMILNIVKHQQEKVPDDYYLLSRMGQLWLWGQAIDWKGFYGDEKRYRVSLPGYPFEGKRYWIDVQKNGGSAAFNMGAGLQVLSSGSGAEPGAAPSQGPEIPVVPDENYEAPRDELERFIVQLWQEFLGIERVGIHDDFFFLNGSSLLATQLVGRITQEYRLEIPMNRFYEIPTAAHLAEVIKELLQKG